VSDGNRRSRSARVPAGLGALPRIVLGSFVILGVVLNLSNVAGLLAFLPYSIVGSVLVIRRTRHPIGWLLLVMAVAFSMVGRGADVTRLLIGTDLASWLPALALLGTMAALGLFGGMALIAAIFPTGRLPRGRSGRMTKAALLVIAAIGLAQVFDPVFVTRLPDGTMLDLHNPIGIAPDWSGWSLFDGPAYLVLVAGLLVCIIGLVARFRDAAWIEREQDKWLLASFSLIVLSVVFGFIAVSLVDPSGSWAWFPALIAFPLPPVAIGIAITRYHLYDIDRIISRTIAYGGLTVVLFAVFTGVNLVLQAIFESLVGGGSVAVAVSTLAVASLFNPLRARLQRVVDRRFNRARRDADQTTDRFARRLGDHLDLDTIGTELTAAAAGALEPMTATFWLRGRAVRP
jgi:hypothetical protein